MTIATKVNFRFGDIVQLEKEVGDGISYRVQLVGVLPGLSILVTAPDIRGQHVALQEGERFKIRIFNGDDALAFPSAVIRSCDQPYPYVHLSYPERIDQVQARNARRARLKLPAQISAFAAEGRIGNPCAAMIRDISTAGAQVESSTDFGPVGTPLMIATTLAFDRIPGRPVLLPAQVKNSKRLLSDDGAEHFYYGVQFVDLPAEADLALSAFVYRHLASQLLHDPID